MGITLTNIRIKNFRSIEYVDLQLKDTNILIGQNNSGKSNILKAVDIALGSYNEISENDIFIKVGERLSNDKVAIIDALLKPINEKGVTQKTFSEFWTSVFTETWISTNEIDGNFVGIRTIIQYDQRKNEYILIRKPIEEWNDSIDESIVGNKKNFGTDMVDAIVSFYMDAHRDAVDDIRNKKSYFGKATSHNDLSDESVLKLEYKLNDINEEIINSIPALKETKEKMSTVGITMGSQNSTVEIEPLARKISDLHKGMDIVYQDRDSEKFSISQHGMGTRSWISFLTLGAYVDWKIKESLKEDEEAENYIMLTMEEPEAHLHPQAQRKLYSQIVGFNGQKLISTHSASVLAQADISSIIYVEKVNGRTNAMNLDIENFNVEEIKKIQREVINTRGELLFSNAIVLCEGITEEQALPIYFEEYFGIESICCGVNIIGIGGQNYKTFLRLIDKFKIPWFIFSDGEMGTIKTVEKAVKTITDKDITNLKNVIILDNGEDYEHHLLASGYIEEIISAINECENNTEYFNTFLEKHNHKSSKNVKTSKPRCKACNQEIYEKVYCDYDGDEGRKRAVIDCCTKNGAKAKYATYIAKKIVDQENTDKKIPPKVKQLLNGISKTLNLSVKEEYENDETV